MLSLRIDLSQLIALRGGLADLHSRLGAMQAEALNIGGAKLTQLAQVSLARRFEVSTPLVGMALDHTMATSQFPTYTLKASNQDFPYQQWVTMRDEKVCKVCGPRDGMLLLYTDINAMWPAHPNCRCRLVPVDVAGALTSLAPSILDEPTRIASEHFLSEFGKAWDSVDSHL